MPDPTRRAFLRGGASLGALAFLTGCDIVDGLSAERALLKVSHFNDLGAGLAVQSEQAGADLSGQRGDAAVPVQRLLSRGRGARGRQGRLQARGRRPGRQQEDRGRSRSSTRCRRRPQITRHICVEGWSAIGKWTGAPLREFLRRVGADRRAKYVWFRCAEGYSTSIDMPTALHPQTQMTFQVRRRDPAAQVRLPDEGAHADQARLQESQARDGDRRHQQVSRRLLGGPGLQLGV